MWTRVYLVLALLLQVSKLDAMHPRDPERREMLATLLYVLQDAPEALLRELWKDVRILFHNRFISAIFVKVRDVLMSDIRKQARFAFAVRILTRQVVT